MVYIQASVLAVRHATFIHLTIYVSVQVQQYIDDPLIHHGALKARWCSEALSAMKEIRQKVHEVALPMLIFHGNDDQLVPFSASEFIFANISSSNKTFEVGTQNKLSLLNFSPEEIFITCSCYKDLFRPVLL